MPITVTALATVTSCTQRVGPGMKHPTEESGGTSAVGHAQNTMRARRAYGSFPVGLSAWRYLFIYSSIGQGGR